MSLPEEDLTCPICCDIFTDPVLLSCSHSFCRTCLKRFWDTGVRECPVCRKKASKSNAHSNLALKNVCEAVLEVRRQSSLVEGEKTNCGVHGEKFKLFCLVDKEPICVVCQSSKLHKTHDCLPVEEAVVDCKDELSVSLKSLQDKLESLKRIHTTSVEMSKYIKNQAVKTQRFIKSQFKQLHDFLDREEKERLEAVRKEEEKKMAGLKDKMKDLSKELSFLTETISVIQEQLKEDDMVLLKNFKEVYDRGASIELDSDSMSGLLIDVPQHLYNMKYRVCEKMLDHIDYTPVTLDPNTAHPCLILSDDLTSLHYSKKPVACCPDNPERFHISAEVVGVTPMGSGSHHWVVDTGSNQDWLLGVASVSVARHAEIEARPGNGFWTLCFRDGALRAMTSPPTPLAPASAPKQIKVRLDYNRGTLSFSDPATDAVIYTFTHTFTEKLLPYFYTQSGHPLRIMPEKILVTMLHQ